jgi:hypothetical protein
MHRGISRQAARARALADIAASELAGLTPEQIEVLGLVGDFAEEMEKEARALEAVAAVIGAT